LFLSGFFVKRSLPWVTSPLPATLPLPQPASASAAPSPSVAAISRTVLRGAVLADLRDRVLARRVDREDAIEAGDLEDLRDVPVVADQGGLPGVRTEPLHAADEDAE